MQLLCAPLANPPNVASNFAQWKGERITEQISLQMGRGSSIIYLVVSPYSSHRVVFPCPEGGENVWQFVPKMTTPEGSTHRKSWDMQRMSLSFSSCEQRILNSGILQEGHWNKVTRWTCCVSFSGVILSKCSWLILFRNWKQPCVQIKSKSTTIWENVRHVYTMHTYLSSCIIDIVTICRRNGVMHGVLSQLFARCTHTHCPTFFLSYNLPSEFAVNPFSQFT